MSIPPPQPVFGVSLNDLFMRDQVAVPTVVTQCILAIDTFGLDVEGIYRGPCLTHETLASLRHNAPGTIVHIDLLRTYFDNCGASRQRDFRNPAHFFHDVESVAALLKLFFCELPEPLVPEPRTRTFSPPPA